MSYINPEWGKIEGNILDQSDLMSILNSIEPSGPINIGTSDLTLDGDRVLSGGLFDFSIENILDFKVEAKTITLFSHTNSFFSFITPDSFEAKLDVSLITSNKVYQLPNTSGIFALQDYVDTSIINAANAVRSGYVARQTVSTFSAISLTGAERFITVTADETQNGNKGFYYYDGTNLNQFATNNRPKQLASTTSTTIVNNYLIGKDILLIIGGSIIFEKGINFTKTTNSNTLTLTSGTFTVPYNYTIIFS